MLTNKKKVLSLLMMFILTVSLFAGCGSTDKENASDNNSSVDSTDSVANKDESKDSNEGTYSKESHGVIMWLSNLSSGVQYETVVDYLTDLTGQLGYEFQVVFADAANDPAGNLAMIKNHMSSDVVGLIASQDGGLKDIMAEYPELYVVGYNTDMRSVFMEDGINHEIMDKDHFLGTIVDGYADGADLGKLMAQEVIDNGYKKVSVIQFPGYAYPSLDEAAVGFNEAIEEHNEGAADNNKITIVGDTKVLEFAPLEEAYFFEDGHSDLDAIVGLLAGVDFIYPTLKTAIANGSASADTKVLTGGFNDNQTIVQDIGGDGVIQFLNISPTENVAWAMIMLDNAIVGGMYSDFTGPEQMDSVPYIIDSKEDIDNVITKGMTGSGDISLAQISTDEIMNLLTRNNEDATYAELKELFSSDKLTTDALK